MDVEKLLKTILAKYVKETRDNVRLDRITAKIAQGAATYADAQSGAIVIGQILTDILRTYLPDALEDGRLYRAIAEILVEKPMKAAGKDVAKIAEAVQEGINAASDIGIRAIIPEMNQDQITGIITGICNADSYESGLETFVDQVAGALEGYVDDIVRENADFQYNAGLSPQIIRIADGKCCDWCSRLAGTYDYEDVRDSGNDVFRRHNNCHCQVLFSPGNGLKRRQNVHSRQWS